MLLICFCTLLNIGRTSTGSLKNWVYERSWPIIIDISFLWSLYLIENSFEITKRTNQEVDKPLFVDFILPWFSNRSVTCRLLLRSLAAYFRIIIMLSKSLKIISFSSSQEKANYLLPRCEDILDDIFLIVFGVSRNYSSWGVYNGVGNQPS